MTSLGTTPARQATAPATRSGSALRQVLLVCGLLSSLLYVTTDILGGLQYEGYSFLSQAISELAAIKLSCVPSSLSEKPEKRNQFSKFV